MNYIYSFNQIRINESTTKPEVPLNSNGVVEVSKFIQIMDIPELENVKKDLIEQLKFFETEQNIAIGPNSKGAKYLIKLIIHQLSNSGISVIDNQGDYNQNLVNSVKQFQKKNNIAETGLIDHSTYNVLFGGKPLHAKKSLNLEIDEDKYKKMVKLVIDKLEGGYYHPYMLRPGDNRVEPNPENKEFYKKSGETMFGLDRHAGHGMFYSTPRNKESVDVISNIKNIESGAYRYKTKEAQQFWTKIDSQNAKNKWKHNYRGGELEDELIELVSEIIKPYFIEYFNKWLNDSAKNIVKRDDRLLFHFIYAVWNGPKFFEVYAEKINSAIDKGIIEPDTLYSIALKSRSKSAREKIMKIFGEPKVTL